MSTEKKRSAGGPRGYSKSSSWIRPAKRMAIYHRDGHCCVYCSSEEKLGLDHVLPQALGGTHDATNLVTACVKCNAAKQSRSTRRWFEMLRDRSVDTDGLSARIRKQCARKLDMEEGARLLQLRRAALTEVQS